MASEGIVARHALHITRPSQALLSLLHVHGKVPHRLLSDRALPPPVLPANVASLVRPHTACYLIPPIPYRTNRPQAGPPLDGGAERANWPGMIGLPVSSSSLQHRTSSVPPPSWPISRRHHVSQTHAVTHIPGTVTESQETTRSPIVGPGTLGDLDLQSGNPDSRRCRPKRLGLVGFRKSMSELISHGGQIYWRTWSCPRRTSASKNGGQCRPFEPATPFFPFGPFASSKRLGGPRDVPRAYRNPRVGQPPP